MRVAGQRGKPTRLTQEVLEKIVAGIKLGVPLKYAAQGAGVGERTLQRWLAEARGGANGLKAALLAGLKEAECEFISANLKIIQKAAKKQWTAASWLLERRYNEYFSANKAENVMLRKQLSDLLKQVAAIRGTTLPETADPPSEPPDRPRQDPPTDGTDPVPQ